MKQSASVRSIRRDPKTGGKQLEAIADPAMQIIRENREKIQEMK